MTTSNCDILELIRMDNVASGDGGDSDNEGEGYEVNEEFASLVNSE